MPDAKAGPDNVPSFRRLHIQTPEDGLPFPSFFERDSGIFESGRGIRRVLEFSGLLLVS